VYDTYVGRKNQEMKIPGKFDVFHDCNDNAIIYQNEIAPEI
jgi:hypothetical protein